MPSELYPTPWTIIENEISSGIRALCANGRTVFLGMDDESGVEVVEAVNSHARLTAVADASRRLMERCDKLCMTHEMQYLSAFDETVDALKSSLAALDQKEAPDADLADRRETR